MSQPGWYPDPTGKGGPPRYWDGTRWLDAPPIPTKKRNSTAWWVVGGIFVTALVVLGLLFMPGGGVLAPITPDGRSDRPSVRPWNELSEEPTEEADDAEGGMALCPDVGGPVSQIDADGRLRGGSMSVVAPNSEGWISSSTYMPWMAEQNSTIREVSPGWVASIDIGTVRAEHGFKTPKQSAKAMKDCMASSWLFMDFTHAVVLRNEPYALEGKEGWYLQVEIHVAREDGIQGDLVDIYVLDLGKKGELSTVIGCSTIDDERSFREVRESLDTMHIE